MKADLKTDAAEGALALPLTTSSAANAA